ncbi:hypothetical protein KI688_009719 [Linnemannia hyalina]|uniref:Uncharacterized protein n=1 Tax=Linnemannia hyalina TaxID=64524 RepID=A0A9P7Y0A6_9FUNG|nr:hypothetical protein KI688_009719 [Linnemannia hyalina]
MLLYPPRRSQVSESFDIRRSLSELSVTGRATWNPLSNHPSSPTRYPLGAPWNEDKDEEDEEFTTENTTELDPNGVHTITLEKIADYRGTLPLDEEDDSLEAGPSGYLQGWTGNGVQSEMVSALIEVAAQSSSTRPQLSPEPAPAVEMGVVSFTKGHSDYDVGVGPHPELLISDTAVTSTQKYTIISHDNSFLDDDNSDNDVVDMKEFKEDELEHYGFQSDDDTDADWQDAYNHDGQPAIIESSPVIDATATTAAVFGCPSYRAFSRDEMIQRCKNVFRVEPKDEQLQVTEHFGQG